MESDFTTYSFEKGKTYIVEVTGTDAIRVERHAEGRPEPQQRYDQLEFRGAIGSGPWREFMDWDTETQIAINAHEIISASEA